MNGVHVQRITLTLLKDARVIGVVVFGVMAVELGHLDGHGAIHVYRQMWDALLRCEFPEVVHQ